MNEYVCAWKSIYTQNGHETRKWWNMRFNSSKPWLLEAVPWIWRNKNALSQPLGVVFKEFLCLLWEFLRFEIPHFVVPAIWAVDAISQAWWWGMRIPTSWTGFPIHGLSCWPLGNLPMCWLWDTHKFLHKKGYPHHESCLQYFTWIHNCAQTKIHVLSIS